MQPALPLRDIHLPAEPHWWPPAPGWWLLAVMLALAAAWLSRLALHAWQRRRRVRVRLALLERERAALGGGSSPAATAQAVAAALRAAALAERPECRALRGEDWLAWLDRGLPDAPFRSGPGRLLLDLPYRPNVSADAAAALLQLARQRLQQDFA